MTNSLGFALSIKREKTQEIDEFLNVLRNVNVGYRMSI